MEIIFKILYQSFQKKDWYDDPEFPSFHKREAAIKALSEHPGVEDAKKRGVRYQIIEIIEKVREE